MSLYRLLYRSEIALLGSPEVVDSQINEIVRAATRANVRIGLSGALIASDGVFIQALEGPLVWVEKTFEKICMDLRHKHVKLIEFAAAESQVFPEWAMVRVDRK